MHWTSTALNLLRTFCYVLECGALQLKKLGEVPCLVWDGPTAVQKNRQKKALPELCSAQSKFWQILPDSITVFFKMDFKNQWILQKYIKSIPIDILSKTGQKFTKTDIVQCLLSVLKTLSILYIFVHCWMHELPWA